MRKAVGTFVLIAFMLTGCSNAADEPSGDSIQIQIQIDGGDISPKGDRVETKTGDVITLQIDSDRAGELHVHSSPEQEFSFEKGTSTLELTIDSPGIVDVEDHETGVVILQLEVS